MGRGCKNYKDDRKNLEYFVQVIYENMDVNVSASKHLESEEHNR